MTETNVTIAIFAPESDTKTIQKDIESHEGCRSRITQPRNLDGNTATWIVIATVAGQMLPHVLGAIKDHLERKRVKRIKIGDWEVENPTPEMVERFMVVIDEKSKQERLDHNE